MNLQNRLQNLYRTDVQETEFTKTYLTKKQNCLNTFFRKFCYASLYICIKLSIQRAYQNRSFTGRFHFIMFVAKNKHLILSGLKEILSETEEAILAYNALETFSNLKWKATFSFL